MRKLTEEEKVKLKDIIKANSETTNEEDDEIFEELLNDCKWVCELIQDVLGEKV